MLRVYFKKNSCLINTLNKRETSIAINKINKCLSRLSPDLHSAFRHFTTAITLSEVQNKLRYASYQNTKSLSLSLCQCWPAFCHLCSSVFQEPRPWAWMSGRWRAFRCILLPGKTRTVSRRRLRLRCTLLTCSFGSFMKIVRCKIQFLEELSWFILQWRHNIFTMNRREQTNK